MGEFGGIINLLPDALANQIAAGEVIQRPASAVKELLENALDAGASKIQLIIKDAGKTLIQVVDNGKGMSETDARLCFERHATSKINSVDDLFKISSFGFRGEALASIAAISHVDLKTKQADGDLGTHVVIEGSQVVKQEPCSHHTGSSFTIKNLFYNTPARRKFLKSDPVELKHVLEEFTRVALPNPDIYFTVHHNDNELYHFPPANLRQRLVNYFGKTINEKIVPLKEQTEFANISGFIGRPELVKRKRSDQYLFVNKRFIKSNYLNHAVKLAYENLIPPDHFPFYVIMLEMDPSVIDVNIHPTKQEIKFENERLIYNLVRVAVKQALSKYSISPSLDFKNQNLAGSNDPFSSGDLVRNQNLGDHASRSTGWPGTDKSDISKWQEFYSNIQVDANEISDQNKITVPTDWQQDELQIESSNLTNSFFQIHDSYVVAKIKSGLMILDQRTAHKRVLYERYLNAFKEQEIPAQSMLFPESFQLNPKFSGILTELLPQLRKVGIQIEKFGGENTFVINSVPSGNTIKAPTEFIQHFVETFAENKQQENDVHGSIAMALANHSAINRGVRLEPEETRELIDQLFACDMPYTGPNGQTCFITLDLKYLQSKFKN